MSTHSYWGWCLLRWLALAEIFRDSSKLLGLSTNIKHVREDMWIAWNFASNASRESLAAGRQVDTMNGELGMCVGRVDIIQLRTNETWDRLSSLETWIRNIQAEETQQSELMRQILAQLPPPPGNCTTSPSFPLPPPYWSGQYRLTHLSTYILILSSNYAF